MKVLLDVIDLALEDIGWGKPFRNIDFVVAEYKSLRSEVHIKYEDKMAEIRAGLVDYTEDPDDVW